MVVDPGCPGSTSIIAGHIFSPQKALNCKELFNENGFYSRRRPAENGRKPLVHKEKSRMNKILTCLAAAVFLAIFTWNVNPAEAGVLLRDCRVKTIEVYGDTIQVQLSFKAEGEEKNIHFQLGSLPNPYASAQLSVLRDALIFRKEVDVLVEDTKKKSLILGVSLSQKTHD
ncbi:MAG: hypothetical protein A2060_00220 [Planctomycetes bacterium GWA2_50_13]|nr:MAG: hypothetical protein A2060_00220 [Planctomycetes bacterium GWA2_50_13]OHB95161.1 MAG: hypothetical protein A3I59_03865 [Planctomycetes bacterium RIFCSPLOWO2_02_FULL_50_16]